MKKIVLSFILLPLLFIACSSDKENPGPGPGPEPQPQPGEIAIYMSVVPDSVLLGETVEFTIKATQENQDDQFTLSASVIGGEMTINGYPFENVKKLSPGIEAKVNFTPAMEGMCRIAFTVVGKNNKTATSGVAVKGYDIPAEVVFSEIPDSVSVKEVTEFTFTVKGREGKEYIVSIDTIIPAFERDLTDKDGYLTGVLLRRGISIAVNRENKKEVSVQSGAENTVRLADMQCIGDYKLLFTVKDAEGKEIKAEKVVKAFSPEEIIIDFLEVDAEIELGMGFEPERYYEKLNRHFNYYQLPEYFSDKHVTTIYTVEVDMPGYPGKTTIPGRGMIVYIGQGGEAELYKESAKGNNRNFLSPAWDNRDNSKLQKTGLHALNFDTNSADNAPGTQTYTLTIADMYGKKASKTLTIIALPYGSEMPYPDDVWKRRYDWSTHVDPKN